MQELVKLPHACIYASWQIFLFGDLQDPWPQNFSIVQPVHAKNVKSKYKYIYTFTVHVETIILLWFY